MKLITIGNLRILQTETGIKVTALEGIISIEPVASNNVIIKVVKK